MWLAQFGIQILDDKYEKSIAKKNKRDHCFPRKNSAVGHWEFYLHSWFIQFREVDDRRPAHLPLFHYYFPNLDFFSIV